MALSPSLRLDQVGVVRGGAAVLTDISAIVRPGRVTVILGPNGAGKSSLVQAIAALIPASGAIRIGARAVAALDPRERARLIGYLPQLAAVHWNVTVEEAVALGRLAHRTPFAGPSTADAAAIATAMTQTDVAALGHRPIGSLSGGERARVLLARVLAGAPAWLLADEPLASLDPAHQIDMLGRFRLLADGGMGIVIVLHDLAHAARLADDVILLRAGRLIAAGTAADVMTANVLGALFDVDVAMMADGAGIPLPIVRGRARLHP